jgi:hypothetical protein
MIGAGTVAALATTAALVLATDAGCTGGEPLPGQDGNSCTVTDRQKNSKGIWYIKVECTDSGSPAHGTHVLPENKPSAWKACVPGTFWPSCKEA